LAGNRAWQADFQEASTVAAKASGSRCASSALRFDVGSILDGCPRGFRKALFTASRVGFEPGAFRSDERLNLRNFGMRYCVTAAGFHHGAEATRIICWKMVSSIVCPVPGIADVDASHFFNSIARRLPKKGLRVADNGFTTQH
jgi:hypothetical protein